MLSHICYHTPSPQHAVQTGTTIVILQMRNLNQRMCQSNSLFDCFDNSLKHHLLQTTPSGLGIDLRKINKSTATCQAVGK